jgi:hypothetical protein
MLVYMRAENVLVVVPVPESAIRAPASMPPPRSTAYLLVPQASSASSVTDHFMQRDKVIPLPITPRRAYVLTAVAFYTIHTFSAIPFLRARSSTPI